MTAGKHITLMRKVLRRLTTARYSALAATSKPKATEHRGDPGRRKLAEHREGKKVMSYIIHQLGDLPVDRGLECYVYLLEYPDIPEIGLTLPKITDAQFRRMGDLLGSNGAVVQGYDADHFCTEVIHEYVQEGDPQPDYEKFPALLVTHIPPYEIMEAQSSTDLEPTYELIALGPLSEEEREAFVVDLCTAIGEGSARAGSLAQDIDAQPSDSELRRSLGKISQALGRPPLVKEFLSPRLVGELRDLANEAPNLTDEERAELARALEQVAREKPGPPKEAAAMSSGKLIKRAGAEFGKLVRGALLMVATKAVLRLMGLDD